MNDTGFLTLTDMAARFQKDERTIRRWCKDGTLPFIKLGSGKSASVLFDWEDVRKRLKEKFGYNMQ